MSGISSTGSNSELSAESGSSGAAAAGTSHNPLGVRTIDHLEFYVDDLEKWAHWHETKLGLYRRAEGGPETGLVGKRSVVVGQGRVNFVFSQPEGDGPESRVIRDYLELHGCGVRDIAFKVDDVARALQHAGDAGATVLSGGQSGVTVDPSEPSFACGQIAAYGDTVHTFVQRAPQSRMFLPGYRGVAGGVEISSIHLMMIDHIVANVEDMDQWVDFYARVFGFDETAHFDINTGRSSLMSKVVGNLDGYIRLPINEPSSANSQIQEFLDEFKGAGVQHIALLTSDIVTAINEMRREGMEFLEVPDTYYEVLLDRVGEIKEDVSSLQQAKILVDRDREDGYLLQLFSKPVFDRPTLFYEIIQRHGNSVGFGEGNFKALFEAIEREQMKRGTL